MRQQRIARKEFIELKKMQSGEIKPGKKPSETEIVPKTFKEKVENYWYHFGKVTVLGLVIAIALSIGVVQCATRTVYDMQIVYFTYNPVPDSFTENMAHYFEKYCEDVNGDGEVHVSVANCSTNPNSPNTTTYTRLQTLVVADASALLYITDNNSVKYFDNFKTNKFFAGKPQELPDAFYKSFDETGNFKKDLKIRIRNVVGMQIGQDKNINNNVKASKNLLKKINSK